MLVEFINSELNEACTGGFAPVANPKKPFELEADIAKAFINEGFLKEAVQPAAKATQPAKEDK